MITKKKILYWLTQTDKFNLEVVQRGKKYLLTVYPSFDYNEIWYGIETQFKVKPFGDTVTNNWYYITAK